MKRGDRVRAKENHEFLNVTKRMVGIVKGQDRYKMSNGKYGHDVEVQFRHKIGTTIFQADELKVIK